MNKLLRWLIRILPRHLIPGETSGHRKEEDTPGHDPQLGSEERPAPDDTDGSIDWYDPFDGAAVAIPIADFIDLHTFAPDETEVVLNAYLEAARDKGYGRVRIIHGKGAGIQRQIVRSCLQRHWLVATFFDAPPEEGGWGATIAMLILES